MTEPGRRPLRLCTAVAILALAAACRSAPPPTIDVPSGWPLPPDSCIVTSAFGTSRGTRTHEGLDLAAPRGTAVRSTAAGRVIFAGRRGGWGRLVVVDHGGGWETRYAHLRRIDVAEGELIGRGQVVGSVGASGNATGHHLHYELRHAGQALDPRPTLRR